MYCIQTVESTSLLCYLAELVHELMINTRLAHNYNGHENI